LPKNLEEIPGWVPKEPRQNRQVAQNDGEAIDVFHPSFEIVNCFVNKYQVVAVIYYDKFTD
jgi:hypothetical protein